MFLGIDIGSSSTKAAVVDQDKKLLAVSVQNLGTGTTAYETVVADVLARAGVQPSDIQFTVATGYGRVNYKGADKQITEITCHAKGVNFLTRDAKTIVDIGGQDAKVIKLDANGKVENFVMNDKCAAGTGRFLDVMAGVFGIAVCELSEYDRASNAVASISSTCTVFAESEVVSKLASGEPISNIVAGVHESVVDRSYGLVRRIGLVEPVAMTGGVALNDALRERFEKRLGCSIQTSEFAQFNGAFGAALLACEGR